MSTISHGALQTPRDDEQFPLKSIYNQRNKNLRSEIQRGNERAIICRNLSSQNCALQAGISVSFRKHILSRIEGGMDESLGCQPVFSQNVTDVLLLGI